MLNLNRPTALAIGAITLIVGVVSPWITVFGVLSAGPTNFTEVGLTLFGCIGLVLVSAFTGRYMRAVSIVVGVMVLAQVAYVWFHLSESQTNEFVKPGWGLYISMLAGLYLIASTWIAKNKVALATA